MLRRLLRARSPALERWGAAPPPTLHCCRRRHLSSIHDVPAPDPGLIPHAQRTLPQAFSLPLFQARSWREDPAQFGSQPASEALPGMPELRPGCSLAAPQVCTGALASGLRVASQETYGQVCTLALFVEAGSMFEREEEVGACHFLEAMAFKATRAMDAHAVLRYTQQHGISTGAVFNQEVLLFKVDALRGSIKEALHLLAEAVLHPRLGQEDMEEARVTIGHQRDEARAQPSVIVAENLWAAAYGAEAPQGRSEKCPPQRAATMTQATLRNFTARNFVAPRMVLAGVGLSHAELMEAARDSPFASVPAVGTPVGSSSSGSGSGSGSGSSSSGGSSSGSSAAGGGFLPTPRPRTVYRGGERRECPDWGSLPPTMAAATSKTQFTHIMLAFPTVGWSEDATVPLCVTDTLLGGGASFSAGGPGKGMYSRLYREALNQYAWIESANAFSTRLYKCGMVGIYGTAPPEHAGELAQLLCEHLARLGWAYVKEAELARARNQLASSVLMNLETRSTLVEDIGRQLLSHGKRMAPEELTARIQRTTAGDIRRVMREAMAHPPALSVVGDDARVPRYDSFRRFFEDAAGQWGAEGAEPGQAAARRAAAGLTGKRL